MLTRPTTSARPFELYASGRFSLKALTKEMYGLGLRGNKGLRISLNGLSKILNNRFYTGIIEIKKTNETYAGIHEPIITQALFNRVQASLQGKTNRKTIKHQMLFRRVFRCRHCTFHIIGETHKGIAYYRCHTTGCPTRSIQGSKLEQAIIRELKKLEYTQEEKDYFRRRIVQLRQDRSVQQVQTTKSLQLQQKQLDDRLNKLTDAYLDQMIDKESFERRKTTLLEERRFTQDRIAESLGNPLMITDRLQYFLELAGNAYMTYRMATVDEKREMINTLTSNRYVDGKSLEVVLDLPFNEVANRFNVTGGSPSRSTPLVWNRIINKILQALSHFTKLQQPVEHEM